MKDKKIEKVCTKCGKLKPLGEFHRQQRGDGHVARCKDCLRIIHKEYMANGGKAKKAAYNKRYWQENKERLKPIFTKNCKNWRKRNKDKAREQCRKSRLKRKFGITTDQYKEMYNKQGGLCAICGNPETRLNRKGNLMKLAVDHCHETKQVRGLLCAGCNTAIGLLSNSTSTLERAVKYIESNWILAAHKAVGHT